MVAAADWSEAMVWKREAEEEEEEELPTRSLLLLLLLNSEDARAKEDGDEEANRGDEYKDEEEVRRGLDRARFTADMIGDVAAWGRERGRTRRNGLELQRLGRERKGKFR